MKGLGSEHDLRTLRTGSRSPSQICTVLAGEQWSTTQVRAASFPVRPVYCITIHQSSPNPTCNSCPARECSPQAAETVDRPHPGWLQRHGDTGAADREVARHNRCVSPPQARLCTSPYHSSCLLIACSVLSGSWHSADQGKRHSSWRRGADGCVALAGGTCFALRRGRRAAV